MFIDDCLMIDQLMIDYIDLVSYGIMLLSDQCMPLMIMMLNVVINLYLILIMF
jgi:hypothetical protein